MSIDTSPLKKAFQSVGSASEVARRLGIRPASVHGWTRCPADHVIAIEQMSGVSRHDLRPDLYPRGATPGPAEIRRIHELASTIDKSVAEMKQIVAAFPAPA